MKNMDTIGSSTYKKIKRDIIFGELKPSSKLKLDEIKKKYPVSLSTIRETLNRLSSEGFVVAEEQRGFFVSPFSREDLIEIAKLRILLESYALNLSLKNGDTDWEGNLVAAHHKLSLIENSVPMPFSLSTFTSPECASTICLTYARPSPCPFTLCKFPVFSR